MNDNTLNLPIYELIFQESDDIGIALVDYPAIEKDFIYFNKEDVKMIFNDEKMMIKGPALIPNKLIYRNDALGERYVYFSENTIIQFVENLMAKDKNKFNLSHSEEYVDLTIVESYFTTETNEFDVPKGSWIVGAKVKDRDVWDKIKDGKYKGYSIQSLFSNELVSFVANSNNDKINNKKSMSKLKNQISDALNKVLFPNEVEKETVKSNFEEIKEVSVWSVEVANTSFEIGETVMYEYDGEQYPVSAGEFRLKDGTKIVTDASGVIVSKEEAPKDADPVEEAPKEEETKEEEFAEETPKEEEESKEEEEKTIDEKLADLKAEILEEVKTMIEDSGKEVADAVEEFGKKVVEFGKQPVEQETVKEEVAVPKLVNKNNKATQFFAQ